jgi:hypothetical protein
LTAPAAAERFHGETLIFRACSRLIPLSIWTQEARTSQPLLPSIPAPLLRTNVRAAHSEPMSDETELEPGDFHIAVKRRDYTDTPWRWEIWAAGKTRAVAQSAADFTTMSEAMKQGKAELKILLQKKFPSAA